MPGRVARNVAVAEIMQSLRRIFKAIQDYFQEISKKYGITGPQLWALKTVAADGSLSLGELSKKMYLHPSTISGVVDRLEKKGFVVRDRGQEDRRVVKVQLTPRGKRIVARAPNPIQGKMIYGLNRLKKKELASIYEAVKALVEIVEAQNVKVTFFFDQE